VSDRAGARSALNAAFRRLVGWASGACGLIIRDFSRPLARKKRKHRSQLTCNRRKLIGKFAATIIAAPCPRPVRSSKRSPSNKSYSVITAIDEQMTRCPFDPRLLIFYSRYPESVFSVACDRRIIATFVHRIPNRTLPSLDTRSGIIIVDPTKSFNLESRPANIYSGDSARSSERSARKRWALRQTREEKGKHMRCLIDQNRRSTTSARSMLEYLGHHVENYHRAHRAAITANVANGCFVWTRSFVEQIDRLPPL